MYTAEAVLIDSISVPADRAQRLTLMTAGARPHRQVNNSDPTNFLFANCAVGQQQGSQAKGMETASKGLFAFERRTGIIHDDAASKAR
jgi:hypothetical protein